MALNVWCLNYGSRSSRKPPTNSTTLISVLFCIIWYKVKLFMSYWRLVFSNLIKSTARYVLLTYSKIKCDQIFFIFFTIVIKGQWRNTDSYSDSDSVLLPLFLHYFFIQAPFWWTTVPWALVWPSLFQVTRVDSSCVAQATLSLHFYLSWEMILLCGSSWGFFHRFLLPCKKDLFFSNMWSFSSLKSRVSRCLSLYRL